VLRHILPPFTFRKIAMSSMTQSTLSLALVLGSLTPALFADEKVKALPSVRFPFNDEQAKKLQQDCSKALGMPTEIANSIGMKLVLVPPGNFEMGPNGSKYRVTLSKPFYMATTETTLDQYRKWKPNHRIEGAEDEFNRDDRPVAMVSWSEAREYCEWLSKQGDEKAAKRQYAIPTEAQWEWAARAGTATPRYFGESDKDHAKYSWFNSTYTPNPKSESNGRGRQPVGKLEPNSFGLYDMLGNVWEWCGDLRADESREKSVNRVCVAVPGDPARFTARPSLMIPVPRT
jgi:formylglycine-generating enzyme required for sulfatase activity